ncbi:unnamed protein product, partial [Polarella glacialis]
MGRGDDWTTDQIQETARAIRRELWDGAAEAQSAMGDAPPCISTSEADLRMFAHDCLCANHEKDYRVLMAFLGLPEDFSLLVLRLTAWGHLEADLLRGRAALSGGPIGVVTIHRGHMRALIPHPACSFRDLFQELLEHQKVAKEMEAVGWRSFLEATPAESPLVPSKRPACLRCQETAVAPDKVGIQTKRHPWLDEAESANEEAGAQPLRMRPAWAWGPRGQEVFSGPGGWTQGLEANDIPCDGPISFHEDRCSQEPWQRQDLRSQEVRARLLSLAGSMPAEDVPNTWQFSISGASYADANADTGTRTWDNPEGDGNLKSEEDGTSSQTSRLGVVRIWSTKRDVSWAFKWHHLDPEDVAEFAMRLAGITIISLVMTFGWCGSPGEYMCWAWAAKAQRESYTPPNPETNDIVPYVSKWLMDDAVILEPDVGVWAHLSMEVMERAMIDVWGDLAINAEKKEEEGDLAETQLLWGLFMDFANFAVSLPDPKRIKAKYLLADLSLRRGCRELKIKLAQELRGSAQYWTTAQPELHTELAVLDLMLNQADRSTWVNPKGDERTVEAAWGEFWDTLDLFRMTFDQPVESSFEAAFEKLLSVRERLALPGAAQKVKWIGGEAVMDRIGAVDWSEKKYMAENAKGLLAIIQAETGAVEEEHIIISVVEFLTFIAFAAAEAGNWQDKIIHYVTDNDNVRAWLNKRRTKNRLARHLIRLLQRLEMENRFTTTGLYIRTYRNELNDWLTREDE